jgi:hypothetical protein
MVNKTLDTREEQALVVAGIRELVHAARVEGRGFPVTVWIGELAAWIGGNAGSSWTSGKLRGLGLVLENSRGRAYLELESWHVLGLVRKISRGSHPKGKLNSLDVGEEKFGLMEEVLKEFFALWQKDQAEDRERAGGNGEGV